ncbi:MAG: hypothetical protein K0Q79_1605 [Flavipsychrobacter sp.]|jgi:hypothetical protein|nr:hypothetical protein [Flavipsychrobacter sp.]
MDTLEILIIHSIFRFIVTMICIKKARELNRSTLNWGLLGFIFPLIAIIAIYVVKYKVSWPESENRVN